MTETYIVYVKTDDAGCISAVNSSAFLEDASEWLEIDRGSGVKFHHAQGNYFDKPIMDDRGIKRYRAIPFVDAPDGHIIAKFFKGDEEYWIFERTKEEMDAEYASLPAPPPTQQERLDALEQAGLERDAALMELAMMLTGGE